jgi:hypothetical protein
VTGTVPYGHLLSPALTLCLFKANAHICTPKMAEDGQCLLCLFPQRVLYCVINLLSLSVAMSLYLAFRGEWPDLPCRIPRVWAWRPKPQFQHQIWAQFAVPSCVWGRQSSQPIQTCCATRKWRGLPPAVWPCWPLRPHGTDRVCPHVNTCCALISHRP